MIEFVLPTLIFIFAAAFLDAYVLSKIDYQGIGKKLADKFRKG